MLRDDRIYLSVESGLITHAVHTLQEFRRVIPEAESSYPPHVFKAWLIRELRARHDEVMVGAHGSPVLPGKGGYSVRVKADSENHRFLLVEITSYPKEVASRARIVARRLIRRLIDSTIEGGGATHDWLTARIAQQLDVPYEQAKASTERAIEAGQTIAEIYETVVGETPVATLMRTGRISRFSGLTTRVLSVRPLDDERTALVFTRHNSVARWDLRSGRACGSFVGHDGLVRSFRRSPDDRTAVTASEDGTVRVWDLESGKCQMAIDAYSEAAIDAIITPDLRHVLTFGKNARLRLLELETGNCLRDLVAEKDESWRRFLVNIYPKDLQVTPDLRYAFVHVVHDDSMPYEYGNPYQVLTYWDLGKGSERWYTRDPTAGSITLIALSADARVLLYQPATGGVRVRVLGELAGDVPVRSPARCGCLTRNGDLFVAGLTDGGVEVWDLLRRQRIWEIRPEQRGALPIDAVRMNPQGKLAAVRSRDGYVQLLDLQNLESVFRIPTEQSYSSDLWLDADTGRVVIQDPAAVEVYDLSGHLLRRFERMKGEVHRLEISPLARWVTFIAADGYPRYASLVSR